MSASKSRRPKRQQKRQRFEPLKRRLEQGPMAGRQIVIEPAGYVKMSDVLGDFAEPYLESAETEDAYRKVLSLAVLAWNASFLPEEEQQAMVDSCLAAGVPRRNEKLKAGLKKIVYALIARKKALFARYRRNIIDFELEDRGSHYHLMVASTAGPVEDAD
jgi:hypothetical protein